MNKKIPGVMGCILIISGFFWGSLYVLGQQIRRSQANEPQIEMVDKAISELSKGAEITGVVPKNIINMAESSEPFMIILNEMGDVTTSSERLDETSTTPPKGVLDYAKKKGINKITWQPKNGVRMAIVVKPYPHGYVLAGRSLKQVEGEENGWLILSGVMTFVTLVLGVLVTKKFFPKFGKI